MKANREALFKLILLTVKNFDNIFAFYDKINNNLTYHALIKLLFKNEYKNI